MVPNVVSPRPWLLKATEVSSGVMGQQTFHQVELHNSPVAPIAALVSGCGELARCFCNGFARVDLVVAGVGDSLAGVFALWDWVVVWWSFRTAVVCGCFGSLGGCVLGWRFLGGSFGFSKLANYGFCTGGGNNTSVLSSVCRNTGGVVSFPVVSPAAWCSLVASWPNVVSDLSPTFCSSTPGTFPPCWWAILEVKLHYEYGHIFLYRTSVETKMLGLFDTVGHS